MRCPRALIMGVLDVTHDFARDVHAGRSFDPFQPRRGVDFQQQVAAARRQQIHSGHRQPVGLRGGYRQPDRGRVGHEWRGLPPAMQIGAQFAAGVLAHHTRHAALADNDETPVAAAGL